MIWLLWICVALFVGYWLLVAGLQTIYHLFNIFYDWFYTEDND